MTENESEMVQVAPVPTIRRLPRYLNYLKALPEAEAGTISCTQIAQAFDLVITQVRKDLACTGIIGKPKVGYLVPELIEAIEAFLGWDNPNDAFLIGTGHLGTALIGYEPFREYGLNIVAAFDIDPAKVGTSVRGIEVLPIDKVADLTQRMHVSIGILTLPAPFAQSVTDDLVVGGIRAIWNFTPANLVVPERVVLENAQLAASLAVLSSKLRMVVEGDVLAGAVE